VDLGQTVPSASGEEPSSLSGVSAVDWAAIIEEPTGTNPPGPPGKPSDSAIDLGAGAPPQGTAASISGASAVEWAALVEEPAPQAGSQPAVEITPSAATPPPHPTAQSGGGEQGVSAEVVDLFDEGAPAGAQGQAGHPHEPPPVPAMASDQEIASDLYPSEPPASSGAADQGEGMVNLGEAPPVQEASEVHLGGAEGIVAEVASESGVDLGELPPVAATSSAMGESPSSRDLIAEAVESDLNMPMPRMEVEPDSPSSASAEEVVLEAAPAPDEPPSSAVDLGSSAVAGMGSSKNLSEELRKEKAAKAATTQEVVDLDGLPETPIEEHSGLSNMEPPASAVDLGSRPEVDPLSLASAIHSTGDSSVNLSEIEDAPREPAGDAQSAEYAESPAQEAVGDEAIEFGSPAAAEEEAAEEAPAGEERELVGAGAAKPSGRSGAWLGGTALGLVLGGGAAVGLWLFGIEPPAGWRLAGGEPAKQAQQPVQRPMPQGGPVAGAPTIAPAESPKALLSRGDFEQAAKAGIEQGEANPEQLALRGEYRWLTYLQNQRKAGKALDPKDKAVVDAAADLSKAANNADAMFWLGHLQEMTGQAEQAKATYAKAAEQFKTDPVQKRRFETARNRLELRGAGAGSPAALLPPGLENDPMALAALLLIALQQPAGAVNPNAPPAGASEDEAGFEFWQAVKQARTQDYADAIKSLDKARDLHDRRRFTHLRKSQNPLSDPTEEIFLNACDQLKEYWFAQEKLKKAGYLDTTAKKDIGKAVDELLKKASEGGTQNLAVADRLVKEKVIEKPADLKNGVEQLLTERKDAATKVADLAASVKASKEEARDLTAKLKAAGEKVAKADVDLKSAAEREAKLKESLTAEEAVVKKVIAELSAAKFLDPRASKDEIASGIQKVVKMAASVDPMGQVRQMQTRAEQSEAALKQRWTPEEMLNVWLPLLEQDRGRKEFAAQAEQDVARVLRDPAATAAEKARAEVIRGLALRNQEKFAAAKEALEKGTAGLPGDKTPWLVRAQEAMEEVSNPAAWFAREADKLNDRGRTNEALQVLGRALEVLPAKDHSAILAHRSLIELDLARASVRGLVPANDARLAAARQDAAAAAKAGLAEGLYATGRVAEVSGQYTTALENYRKALAVHPALDAAGSRYRMAVARVLLQPREAKPAGTLPAPAAQGDRVGRLPAMTLDLLALFSVVGLQDPQADSNPGREEAERLAEEVLRLPPASVPFNVRAQAFAVKGQWTAALTTYVEGLRGHLPPEHVAGLLDLVLAHPGMKRTEFTAAAPNPLEAEKHYAAGLNFFFDNDYPAAEKEFLAAVADDASDARYYYFLGLARFEQGNQRAAMQDLEQGSRLEAMNRPASAAVSEALERIQGPVRQILNDVRKRPR
jgi:tetratricopeptide (TPR) repeat protein